MNAEELEREREQEEVKTYCRRLLLTADIKDVYPTPVDRIVEAAELVKSNDLTLLDIKPEVLPRRIWKRLKGSITDIISIVRAGLFPKEKTIFINPNAPTASIPFATLHECVHSILPWQNKTFNYLDDEYSLDPKTRSRFEREANLGGAYLLWQGEDFIKKAADMSVSAATPVSLANLFGGSIHSSMRYYVENHGAAVGLLVFYTDRKKNFFERYSYRFFGASRKFKDIFGPKSIFLSKDEMNVLLTREQDMDLYWEGEINLSIDNESYLFKFSGYETPYNIFIIIVQDKIARKYGKAIVVIKSLTTH